MVLFKKKQKQISVPTPEVPTEYRPENIEHRVKLLVGAVVKLDEKLEQFSDKANELNRLCSGTFEEIRRELEEIKSTQKEMVLRFQNIIAALNLTAKIEDYEKLRKIVDQYDPIDMITREQFLKQIE